MVAFCELPTGDLTCNPGMCPDWESNLQPFGSLASVQSAEPHQPGLKIYFLKENVFCDFLFLQTNQSFNMEILKQSDFFSILFSVFSGMHYFGPT